MASPYYPQVSNQPQTKGYTPFQHSPRVEQRVSNPERDLALLPTALNTTEDVVLQATQQGQGAALVTQAREVANAGFMTLQEQRTNALMDGYTEQRAAGVEPDVQQTIMELTEVLQADPLASRFVDPVIAANVFQSDNELAKEQMFQRLTRVALLTDELSKRMQTYDETGWLRTGYEFVDSLVSIPIYSSLLTESRKDMAGAVSRLMASDVTDEQFVQLLNGMFDDVADQGVLSGDNRFFLQQLLMLLPEGGEGPEARSQSLWTAVDAVLTLAPAAGKAGTAASAARGLVRNGVTRPDLAAVTSAATNAVSLVGQTAQDAAGRITGLISGAARRNQAAGPVNPVGSAPSAVTPQSVRSTYLTAPEHQALLQLEEVNPYLERVIDRRAGEAIDQPKLIQIQNDRLSQLRTSGRTEVIDVDIYADGMNNLFQVEQLGTRRGLDFASRSNAQRLANQVGGEVVEVGPNQFRVSVEVPLPLGQTDIFRTTNVDNLSDAFFARYGSPQAQTDDFLASILFQSEAGRAAITAAVNKEIKRLKGLFPIGQRGKSIRAVDSVFSEMNYGRWAADRSPMTDTTFRQRFHELNGREPTPNEVDFAMSFQQLNNTDYYIKADPIFKDYVNRGFSMFDFGNGQGRVMARTIDPTEILDEVVFDLDKGSWINKDSVPKNYKAWEMGDTLLDLGGGRLTQYAVGKTANSRRLYHSDVLPYNPGGPRKYMSNEVKFFVKQPDHRKTATGKDVTLRPRTFMGVKTEKEAFEARKQINNILEEFAALVPKGTPDAMTAARGVTNNARLRKAVAENNDWNYSIQTVDDFLDFLEDNGLSLHTPVDYASDGAAIGDMLNPMAALHANQTLRDSFRVQGNPRLGRSDDVLIRYGGRPNRTKVGVQTIEQSLMSSVAVKAETSYLLAATQGLVQAVVDAESRGTKALRSAADLQQLSGKTQLGQLAHLLEHLDPKTAVGSKLRLEAQKIQSRLHTNQWSRSFTERMQNWFSDSIYNKYGENKVSSFLDAHSMDPIAAAKSYVFDQMLGLFAWDQFYVQASQVFNVAAVSPSGAMGAALYGPVRFLMINGNDNVLATWAKWLAPKAGLTDTQFIDMVTMLRNSGRMVADLSIAEMGEAASAGAVRSFRQAGRFFFNEGEFVGRITAHNAAFMEYVKKFPTAATNDQTARRWIMNRADKLTQSMTGVSQAPIQQLPGFQFMGYMWHFAEQIFAGSLGGKAILSRHEKMKLLTSQVLLFGVSGLGLGKVFDAAYQEGEVNVDPALYTTVRYGLLDTLVSTLVGADTALGNRLAWAQGVTDTFSNLADKNIMEAFTGASGQSFTNTVDMTFKLVGDLAQGNTSMGLADLNTILRQVKSYDLAHNTYTAFMYGKLYSRNGQTLNDSDVDQWEAVAAAWGIPSQDVLEAQSISTTLYERSQTVDRFVKDLERMSVAWTRAVDSGDEDGAEEIYRGLTTHLAAIYNDNPRIGQQVFQNFRQTSFSRIERSLLSALENGLTTREIN